MIKNIGILTSGGDSPGMNATIRSIVKSSIYNNINVYGIKKGYLGLFENDIEELNKNKVSNIFYTGGTILGSSRFDKFKDYNIRLKSIKNLYSYNIKNLIIIGGNGSYIGALELSKMGLSCICIPGTIDNDISGTDFTIGFFTALENITNLIDILRDTASSHKRILVIEVMGRNCGNLAIYASISSGCEFLIIPEKKFDIEELIKKIQLGFSKNKKNFIIIITENTYDIKLLSQIIEKKTKKIVNNITLGHLQRGGKPVSLDRILGSQMGNYAVELIMKNNKNKCIGVKNNKLITYEIEKFINLDKNIFNINLFNLNNLLF